MPKKIILFCVAILLAGAIYFIGGSGMGKYLGSSTLASTCDNDYLREGKEKYQKALADMKAIENFVQQNDCTTVAADTSRGRICGQILAKERMKKQSTIDTYEKCREDLYDSGKLDETTPSITLSTENTQAVTDDLNGKLPQIPIFKQFSSSDFNQEKNITAKITFVSQDSYKNGPASIGNNGAIYVKNDVIVMGQFYGLSVSKDNGVSWKTFTINDGLAHNRVSQITRITDNLLLIGTPDNNSSINTATTASILDISSLKITTVSTRASNALIDSCFYGTDFNQTTLIKWCLQPNNTFLRTPLYETKETLRECSIQQLGLMASHNGILFIPCTNNKYFISSDEGKTLIAKTMDIKIGGLISSGHFLFLKPQQNSGKPNCELMFIKDVLRDSWKCMDVGPVHELASAGVYGLSVTTTTAGKRNVFINTSEQNPTPVFIRNDFGFINAFSKSKEDYYFTTAKGLEIYSGDLSTMKRRIFTSDASFTSAIDIVKFGSLYYVSSFRGIRVYDENFVNIKSIFPTYSNVASFTEDSVKVLSDPSSYSFQVYSMLALDNELLISVNSGVTTRNDLKLPPVTYSKMVSLTEKPTALQEKNYLARNIEFRSAFVDGDSLVAYSAADKAIIRVKISDLQNGSINLEDHIILQPVSDLYNSAQLFNDVNGNRYFIFGGSFLQRKTLIYKWNYVTRGFDLFSSFVPENGRDVHWDASFQARHAIFNDKLFYEDYTDMKIIDLTTEPAPRTMRSDELSHYCGNKPKMQRALRSESHIHFFCSENDDTDIQIGIMDKNNNILYVNPGWSSVKYMDFSKVIETPKGYIYASEQGLVRLNIE